jgi:hypothetical protein
VDLERLSLLLLLLLVGAKSWLALLLLLLLLALLLLVPEGRQLLAHLAVSLVAQLDVLQAHRHTQVMHLLDLRAKGGKNGSGKEFLGECLLHVSTFATTL